MADLFDLLEVIVDIGKEAIKEQSKNEKIRNKNLKKAVVKSEELLDKFEKNISDKKKKSKIDQEDLTKSDIYSKTNTNDNSDIKREDISMNDYRLVKDIEESLYDKKYDKTTKVEETPLDERLKRYKETKKKMKVIQKEVENITSPNVKMKSKNKYKRVLKNRNSAKDAFIYSTIFERKV